MLNKKSRLFGVRVDAATAEAWRAAAKRAGHRSLSAWLRAAGEAARGRGPRLPLADPAVVGQLARIGNNLNQLARAANRDPAAAGRLRTLAELAAIEERLRELAARC